MHIIKIDHIAKVEGHTGFIAKITDGRVKDLRLDVKEGARLIEGILVGRDFREAPIIVSRICGICPLAHNLACIKALEQALGIKPSSLTILLRKLLTAGQIIQSHSLHIFFLAMGDFFKIPSSLKLARKFPKEMKKMLILRDLANQLVDVISGRPIHALITQVGGWTKLPEKDKLKAIFEKTPEVLKETLNIVEFLARAKRPEFIRQTECVGLALKKEYALYDGNVISSKKKILSKDFKLADIDKFDKNFQEFQRPYEVVKMTKYQGSPYLVGALARINLRSKLLNPKASWAMKKLSIKVPDYNLFDNTLAQMVEIVHLVEEIPKLLKLILKENFAKEKNKPIRIKAGSGLGVLEAPRGTLYHYYKIDSKGIIQKANIVPPTAQFLANLEEDLKVYLPKLKKFSSKKERQMIKMLVRAYDPCISCAVH